MAVKTTVSLGNSIKARIKERRIGVRSGAQPKIIRAGKSALNLRAHYQRLRDLYKYSFVQVTRHRTVNLGYFLKKVGNRDNA